MYILCRFALVLGIALFSGPLASVAHAATIAVGALHTCAIGDAARELRCWGWSSTGRLGNGTGPEVDRAAPWPVSTTVPAWRAVAAGENHSCAIAVSGRVHCWGTNSSGQLGDGTTTTRSSPAAVVGLGTEVAQIAVGWLHSCALMRSGRINCWGYGASGQLGSGQASNQTTPGEVSGIVDAIAVGAGGQHTCAALSDGAVKCWGLNNYGQIGDGTGTNRFIPVFSSVGLNAVELAIGGGHSCARSAAGEMRCWGYNGNGELGDGTTTLRLAGVPVSGLSSGVTRIAAGGGHTCALVAPGTLKCWGWNLYGQLGNGATASALVPTDVVGLPQPVIDFSAGRYHTCMRSTANRVLCWGDNYYGETGFGTPLNHPPYVFLPQRISALPALLGQLSLRGYTACAVTRIGSASCWGNNDSGQIGDNISFPYANPIHHAGPRDVAGLGSGVRNIATGDQHACAVKNDGTVWCWGSNASGQLGDQTALPRRTPVQVIGLTNVVQIATSASFTCARTAVGAVWCWGLNTNGQLGIGSTTNSLQAGMAVGLSQGVVDLSLGATYACAVRDDGKVWCWGRNDNGQLGDGSLTQRNVPTLVNDNFGVYVAVAAGSAHTCGMTDIGLPKCWGANSSGQLGDGSVTARATPAAIVDITGGMTKLSAGRNHNCALRSDGVVMCWGENGSAQIGDGGSGYRSRPTVASNVSGTVQSLALGGNSSCAVLTDGHGICWGNNDYGRLGNGSMTPTLPIPQRIAEWLQNDSIFRDDFEK